jgi:hypothetical protein
MLLQETDFLCFVQEHAMEIGADPIVLEKALHTAYRALASFVSGLPQYMQEQIQFGVGKVDDQPYVFADWVDEITGITLSFQFYEHGAKFTFFGDEPGDLLGEHRFSIPAGHSAVSLVQRPPTNFVQ